MYEENKGSHLSNDCEQERIQFLQPREDMFSCSEWKRNCRSQFGVFDLNTLNPQVLFSINVLLAIQKVGSIYASTVQEMSPHPSSSFLPSGRKKSCEVEPKQKNTRMRKIFIQSVTNLAGKKKIRILAIGVLSYYLLLLW